MNPKTEPRLAKRACEQLFHIGLVKPPVVADGASVNVGLDTPLGLRPSDFVAALQQAISLSADNVDLIKQTIASHSNGELVLRIPFPSVADAYEFEQWANMHPHELAE